MPFLILPPFVLATILTAYPLGLLAVTSLTAPIAFYAGWAIYAARRGESQLARRRRRLEAEVRRRLQEVDPSESLYSLSYFEARLEQEIKRCVRHKLPLCVLTIRLGLEDAPWASLATEMVSLTARFLRSEDSLCHVSGETFAVCLPHTTPAGAAVVIARLAQELRAYGPRFGLAFLPPGRDATSQAIIEHALRTTVRAETAAAAASQVAERDGDIAA